MIEQFLTWCMMHPRALGGCGIAFALGIFSAALVIEGPHKVWAELFATEGR